jgi:hypothetical protein
MHVCLWGASYKPATPNVDMLEKHILNLPWLMLGDFNETMWKSKHFSERKEMKKEMLDF